MSFTVPGLETYFGGKGASGTYQKLINLINEFEKFLKNALNREKELEYWKAESTQEVKDIVYN